MKNVKEIFVVDLEATCWETKQEQGYKPNEIIEIGICRVDLENEEVHQAQSWIVKPRFTEVSPFCTKLTTLTQEIVDNGFDIVDALREIKQVYSLTREDIWCSWGQYDRNKLSNQGSGSLRSIYGHEIDSIFAQMEHFNLKTLFALQRKIAPCGMAKALQICKLPLIGTHHRGDDDAHNIGRIALQMFK